MTTKSVVLSILHLGRVPLYIYQGFIISVVGLLQDGDIVTLTGKTEIPLNGVYTWYEISAPVEGWANMPPEKRKIYVRGLVCFFCNRYYLAKAINQDKARNIVRYLDNYALRQK